MASTQAAAEVDTAVIDVTALVSAMKEKLDVLPKRQPYTFPRVPAYYRKINENFYEPMVISFGPYHHGSPHLQAMEKHKWRYLRDFLSRSTTGATLDDCLKKMKVLEERACSCYSESSTLTNDEFVEMMLLDACFIIELAFKLYKGDWGGIHLGWGVKYIRLDLLLIENQIPFFIIKRLFDLVCGTTHLRLEPSLMDLILSLYLMNNILKEPSPLPEPPTEIHHLLHLYYHWFVASVKPSTVPSHWSPLRRAICLLFSCFSSKTCHEMSSTTACVIPCATELRQAGVIFKKKRMPSHSLDITFQEGVMEIPVFSIVDSTKPLFTNLIAYEQSVNSTEKKMTSFCALMDYLINTEKDVAILQRCDVIENWLGSEEEAARFFNQLGTYVTYGNDHYLSEVFKQVNHYRNSKWNNYRARLVQDYFSNPWAFLSLVAAIVLLLLTFLQTFFTMYTYFRSPRLS